MKAKYEVEVGNKKVAEFSSFREALESLLKEARAQYDDGKTSRPEISENCGIVLTRLPEIRLFANFFEAIMIGHATDMFLPRRTVLTEEVVPEPSESIMLEFATTRTDVILSMR